MVKDFNASKRARLEALGEAPQFVFGEPERTFTLPVEFPLDFVEFLAEIARKAGEANTQAIPFSAIEDVKGCVRALLNGQAEDYFALHPAFDDLIELVNWASQEMSGQSAGESVASGSSSTSTSKSSRPRSSGNTGSRSRRSSTAKTA